VKGGGARRTTANVKVGSHTLVISNESKILWPGDVYTKGDLIRYYRSVAEHILPHLKDRPLTLQRYPDGIDGPSFFEKNAPSFLPDWVKTISLANREGERARTRFILCNDEPTLVYVANLAAIVLHVWTSRAGAIDTPDFIFFDLDPNDGCTLATLAKTALALRNVLAEIGLSALVKSSGGSGLHVVIPLRLDYTYEVARNFAEVVAREVHRRLPETTTLQRVPAKRTFGSVYLDYVQVGRGKTMVAPLSVRARAKAPVSMPLDWAEIETMSRKRSPETEAEFARFTLKNALRLLGERGDLWGGGHWKPQRLEPAVAKARKTWPS
jgi:bifunctional non-homologous end joining protein LigD